MNTPYEYYNNKLGVKISYLIFDKSVHPESLKLISYKALHGRMKSNTCAEKQLRRASLNYEALIEFNSLTQNWRDQLTTKFGSAKQEIKKSFFEKHYETDKKASDFYNAYRFEDNKMLDPFYVKLYTYNASVIQTVLKVKNDRKQYIKSIGAKSINIWESITNDVNAFREVYHKLPTTSRGIRNQVAKFEKEGYAGLISAKFANNNANKVKENEQIALIDELLAQHQNFDNTQVANFYNMVAKRLEWQTITPQTIANRKESRSLLITAGRKGENALSNNKLMQNKRSAPVNPMLYWTLDGWDAELLYQSTTINKLGYSTTTYHNRLNVVMVLDPFNKYIIGYAIGTHETPELIKSALRNAFIHNKELFGVYYKPYQLQSDNYGKGALRPLYEACSTHYTPAKVKNAKAKVIEPFFNRFNKEYLQIFPNWSGHNVTSLSENQPNAEFLNKISKTFPDEQGCRQQIISAIEADREKKQQVYVNQFANLSDEYKNILTHEMFLKVLGNQSKFTNRLTGPGLVCKINGQEMVYDSFDINFRKQAHFDWVINYNPENLKQVLVTNAESRNGKLVKEIGTYQFLLEQKHIQPMALAERTEGDALKLQEVNNFNKEAISYITDTREDNAQLMENLFQRPELNNTLAKLLLVDSKGQHKNNRNKEIKENSKQLIEVEAIQETKKQETNWYNEQFEYHKQKVDINEYL